MNLSAHITLEEAIHSQLAERMNIANVPTQDIFSTMQYTASQMELVRALLNDSPLIISSFYRCKLLNSALKSKLTSQHIKGEAVDFICPNYGSPIEIARLLADNKSKIDFDQLIYEYSWVHVSFVQRAIPRNAIYTLMPNGTYAHGIVEK